MIVVLQYIIIPAELKMLSGLVLMTLVALIKLDKR